MMGESKAVRAWETSELGIIVHEAAKTRKTHRFIAEIAMPYSGDDCLIWPYKESGGYGALRMPVSRKWASAHRLVCELVHGSPPSNKHHAAHSCGNGNLGCVNPKHLSWKTPKGNAQDRFKHGTDNGGERNGRAKLCKADVIRIRRLRGIERQSDLAKQYHVSDHLISAIHTGRRWRCVNE